MGEKPMPFQHFPALWKCSGQERWNMHVGMLAREPSSKLLVSKCHFSTIDVSNHGPVEIITPRCRIGKTRIRRDRSLKTLFDLALKKGIRNNLIGIARIAVNTQLKFNIKVKVFGG